MSTEEVKPQAMSTTTYTIPVSRTFIYSPRLLVHVFYRDHTSMLASQKQKLDDLHTVFKEYLDGKLSFAPLEESKPQSILELGTGTGVWAIQAATQFPDAKVLAVDACPLPIRPIPPNMKFRILDMMNPFPFEPESFDVIHARFVLMHVPKPESVILRIIKLLKPGGWLLLGDLDFKLIDESELGLGPASKEWVERYYRIMKSKGVHNDTPVYDKTLLASRAFSEVNVKTIHLPVSEKSGDPKLNKLGAAFRTACQRVAINMANQSVPGFSLALGKEYSEELNDSRRNTTLPVVFAWAKKRV
ncbi:S-adenosyl-L-methionine-dependent methyltransferase [Ramaria rubella]|nr:S-adenosyl-L-methionine-dependent methyltransferase [Ramaria rubella]